VTSQADSVSSGPHDSPGFLLWRTTLRWQRSITAALRPLELTHVQFVLLAAVWWLSEQANSSERLPSQRQVAEHAAADVMMTSQVLRALESRGLVARTLDPADARVKRLTVTAGGRRLAEQAISVVDAADAEFFTRARDPAQLLDVLHQLADESHGSGPRRATRASEAS
jgi:DNA-binding MarR family transcriptional regulator